MSQDDRNILNKPFETNVCERMIGVCQKLKSDLSGVILSKTLDRETYLTKMGELNATREIERQLISIYKGEFGL